MAPQNAPRRLAMSLKRGDGVWDSRRGTDTMKDSNSKRPRVSVELVKQAKKGEATPGIYRDAKGVGLVLKIEEPGAHAPEGAVGGPARWVSCAPRSKASAATSGSGASRT